MIFEHKVKQALEFEISVFEKLMRKNKNQHKSSKFYKNLLLVQRMCKRLELKKFVSRTVKSTAKVSISDIEGGHRETAEKDLEAQMEGLLKIYRGSVAVSLVPN